MHLQSAPQCMMRQVPIYGQCLRRLWGYKVTAREVCRVLKWTGIEPESGRAYLFPCRSSGHNYLECTLHRYPHSLLLFHDYFATFSFCLYSYPIQLSNWCTVLLLYYHQLLDTHSWEGTSSNKANPLLTWPIFQQFVSRKWIVSSHELNPTEDHISLGVHRLGMLQYIVQVNIFGTSLTGKRVFLQMHSDNNSKKPNIKLAGKSNFYWSAGL